MFGISCTVVIPTKVTLPDILNNKLCLFKYNYVEHSPSHTFQQLNKFSLTVARTLDVSQWPEIFKLRYS